MESVSRITVFVASPSDVDAERAAVSQVIDELNLLELEDGHVVLQVKKWETHTWPGFGEDAQSLINEQIGDYDIFLGIFWNRLGSPTKRAKSGTVEEYDRAFASWQKRQRPSLMFYFKEAATIFESERELKQRGLVLKFEKAVRKHGLTCSFPSTMEFAALVRRHLQSEIKRIVRQSKTAAPATAGPAEAVRGLLRKLGYWHTGPTLRAITLIEQAAAAAPREVKEAAITGLREFMLAGLEKDEEVATERARLLHVAAFKAIRSIAGEGVADYFREGEMEAADLVRVDFSGLNLTGLRLQGSFIIEANFRNAVLDGCSFEGASIRNADFAGASLKNADMRGADWFNALNLTEAQLRSAMAGTLMPMPASVVAFRKYVAGRYLLPFDSWTEEVKSQLTAAWAGYLKKGGLGEKVGTM